MGKDQYLLAFIQSTFRSVWALEILLHLKAVAPLALDRGELVESLRASNLVVQQSLEALLVAGLVEFDAEDKARYAPRTAELEQMATAAQQLYAKSPDLVRRTIVSAATPGVTAFSDAFKLKKD